MVERRLRAQGKVVQKHAAGNIFENHEIIVENRMACEVGTSKKRFFVCIGLIIHFQRVAKVAVIVNDKVGCLENDF